MSAASSRRHARVAVPVPLPEPLTYSVPADLDSAVVPGVRVRVTVGRRRLIGLVVGRTEVSPEGVRLRDLEAVLDREPVLDAELLDLAAFIADYYLCPPGEVVRAMLPAHLPPWGERKVWITDAGALARPRNPAEAQVLEALAGGGRTTLADLARRLPQVADLPRVIEELSTAGRLASGGGRPASGSRYVTAVELPPGDLEEQREACGRSPQARAVVEHLATLGRPALLKEVATVVGCSDAVVRRLVKLGVVRSFTQVERLSLGRHRLSAGSAPVEELVLRPLQARAVEVLHGAVAAREFAAYLLRGLTGSGKTEVYLRAAEAALELGRSAILLVPEIALVPALARAVERRFQDRVAILHSGLSAGERHQEWERIRRGGARVVLGPRSAVFAPLEELGLVVVDEEQDPSYKQDQTPRYHGRDVALVRGRAAGATVVLVSATPSLESRLNVERGRLAPLVLEERVGGGAIPEGVLVDLRQEKAPRKPGEVTFSPPLLEELERAFAAGDQAILLRNRRGYSPLLLCRACGEDCRCDACGLPRTLHRRAGRLLCHYCGSTLPVPERCPACGEPALEPMGAGTERVEERFAALFPDVPAGVLDADTARRGGAAAVLERFARGDTRVLIGTQMVSKGHHFPRVALAAVLAADTYLGFPDFRAVERTYNLLVQLGGRAGRGDRPGRVVIQTYHPEHYAIQAALAHDDAAFAEREMHFRRVFHYPPYTRMVQVLSRDRNRDRAAAALADLSRRLSDHPLAREVRLTGPAPAPLERLRHHWRFQMLLRGPSVKNLHRLVEECLPERPGVDLVVDVDPQDLM